MEKELRQMREALLAMVGKIDEMLTAGQQVQKAAPIDPPPPDKPKH